MVELYRRRRADAPDNVCLDRKTDGYRNGRKVEDTVGHRGAMIEELGELLSQSRC